MSYGVRRVAWTMAAAVWIVGLWSLVGTETYFLPYPAIDTRFAPAFEEAHFNLVQVGMSKSEVLGLIGAPLHTDEVAIAYASLQEGAVEVWSYSADGAWQWADFAWLSRCVYFDRNGRVTEAEKRVYYD